MWTRSATSARHTAAQLTRARRSRLPNALLGVVASEFSATRRPTRALGGLATSASLRASPIDASPSSRSETSDGLLSSLLNAEQDSSGSTTGTVLSHAGGIVKASLLGAVAVGQSVDLGNGGLGVVLRYDKQGALVAPISRGTYSSHGDQVSTSGPLVLRTDFLNADPSAKSESSSSRPLTFVSVPELVGPSDTSSASHLFRLPSMPAPTRRQPVTRRMPSGLIAAEALQPLAEGHRVGLVGPSLTGKTTAAQMILASQAADTACVYVTNGEVSHLQAKLQAVLPKQATSEAAPFVVVHTDMRLDTLGAQYLAPLCGLQLISHLRKKHKHVLLVLDNLISFAEASESLGKSTVPLNAAQIIGATLDSAGSIIRNSPEDVSAVSVVTVLDANTDDDLPPFVRNLWRGTEQSLDVCLYFSSKVLREGILPAIDITKLLAAGFTPPYQARLMQRLRSDLLEALRHGRDESSRLELSKDLRIHIESHDQEDSASRQIARRLFSQKAPRSLEDTMVILAASLVYYFPRRSPSPATITGFQDALVETISQEHPILWNDLVQALTPSSLGESNMEAGDALAAISDEESFALLNDLGEALLARRFDFNLSRPE